MDPILQQRLSSAFAASGLSQAELARASGIDRASISLYLSGRYNPKADKLLRLASALGVSPEWLTGGETGTGETALSFPVSLGISEEGSLTYGRETLSVPRSLLEGGRPEQFFVLEVTGTAMYPRLVEGDRLLVHRAELVAEGSIAVLSQGTALLVRCLERGQLRPFNPEYAPRPMTRDMHILGQAVSLVRKL